MKMSKEVRDEIKLYQSQDYEIDEETQTYILMKKNKASIGIHVLLALTTWWLLFIPNFIYYFVSIKKKKIMK